MYSKARPCTSLKKSESIYASTCSSIGVVAISLRIFFPLELIFIPFLRSQQRYLLFSFAAMKLIVWNRKGGSAKSCIKNRQGWRRRKKRESDFQSITQWNRVASGNIQNTAWSKDDDDDVGGWCLGVEWCIASAEKYIVSRHNRIYLFTRQKHLHSLQT